VGLLLGDLFMEKRSNMTLNVRLMFLQGLLYKDYLVHLYDLFKLYCSTAPKTTNPAPDKITGKKYISIKFRTLSLPCFTELYNLFYLEGKKVIPLNMAELLTFSPQMKFVEKKLITFFPYGKQDSLH
jgi:hypothetical protein